MWDIIYPVLVMEDVLQNCCKYAQIPTLSSAEAQEDGFRKLSPVCCLRSFASPVVTQRAHSAWQGLLLETQLLLSEDKQLKFSALGSSRLSFVVPFRFLSCCLLKGFLLVILFCVWNSGSRSHEAETQLILPAFPGAVCPRWRCPRIVYGKEGAGMF